MKSIFTNINIRSQFFLKTINVNPNRQKSSESEVLTHLNHFQNRTSVFDVLVIPFAIKKEKTVDLGLFIGFIKLSKISFVPCQILVLYFRKLSTLLLQYGSKIWVSKKVQHQKEKIRARLRCDTNATRS